MSRGMTNFASEFVVISAIWLYVVELTTVVTSYSPTLVLLYISGSEDTRIARVVSGLCCLEVCWIICKFWGISVPGISGPHEATWDLAVFDFSVIIALTSWCYLATHLVEGRLKMFTDMALHICWGVVNHLCDRCVVSHVYGVGPWGVSARLWGPRWYSGVVPQDASVTRLACTTWTETQCGARGSTRRPSTANKVGSAVQSWDSEWRGGGCLGCVWVHALALLVHSFLWAFLITCQLLHNWKSGHGVHDWTLNCCHLLRNTCHLVHRNGG